MAKSLVNDSTLRILKFYNNYSCYDETFTYFFDKLSEPKSLRIEELVLYNKCTKSVYQSVINYVDNNKYIKILKLIGFEDHKDVEYLRTKLNITIK